MRKTLACALLVAFTFFLGGCAGVATPAVGVIYSDVKWGIEATPETGSKQGSSSATSILGAIATGDASIEAAKRNGNITKVSHVDFHSTNILGFYAKITCTVYGE